MTEPLNTQPPAGRQWSLTWRLAWRLALVTLCAILLAASAVAWRTLAELRDLDDAAMQQQVRFLIHNLPVPPAATPFILPPAVVDRFRFSDDDTLFLILGSGGRRLSTSNPAEADIVTPFLPRPLSPGFFLVPPLPGHPRGLLGFAATSDGRIVVLVQGRTQVATIIDGLTTQFLGTAIWLLLPLGVLMLGVSIFTLRNALRPLTLASAAAAAIRPGDVGSRLPLAGLPREITPLVTAVNDALNRLEFTITAQRGFMAQAAHGLRTPLAVLAARIDTLPPTPETQELRQDVDRMSRLLSQLLGMARLESLPLRLNETIELRDAAKEAITSLAPLAVHQGVDLALTGAASLKVTGNHAALVLALTNLIENALGYAPPGTSVEVALQPPASVMVRDRGPGIPPAEAQRLLRAFERGAHAKQGGAGLGLAIVSEIATAHGGHVQLSQRPGGGAEVELSLGK
ncbi:HAMP domain-containing sensor histidine kinase [Acidocella sp.]|uniref:sensor histidine kinase n=1 Tax=Acidocella sp. TaxID=50710 RepID=UPI002602D67D|nr:HAMP domain-containing sensor histidine kinase [Acidocella sp.]